MSLLGTADRLPPCVCRLVAKVRDGKGWRGLSHREIAAVAKIPKSNVAKITYRKTWRSVKIEVIDSFSEACGVDHLKAKRVMTFLRTRKLAHTETGSIVQLRMYTRLWRLYAEITKEQQS